MGFDGERVNSSFYEINRHQPSVLKLIGMTRLVRGAVDDHSNLGLRDKVQEELLAVCPAELFRARKRVAIDGDMATSLPGGCEATGLGDKGFDFVGKPAVLAHGGRAGKGPD